MQTDAEVAMTGERVTSIGFQSQQLCWEPASSKHPLYGSGLEATTPEVGAKMLTNNAQTSNLWEGRVVFPYDQAADVEYAEYFTVATSRFRSMKCNYWCNALIREKAVMPIRATDFFWPVLWFHVNGKIPMTVDAVVFHNLIRDHSMQEGSQYDVLCEILRGMLSCQSL